MGPFEAQVRGRVAKVKEAMLAVYRESAQRTIEYAQTPVAAGGNMPVRTGFLRASGQAVIGTEAPPLVGHPGGFSFSYDPGAVALVIARAGLEDTITFAYTANYAIFQEYGARGMAGHRFVGLAAQRWQQTVEEVSREAAARLGG